MPVGEGEERYSFTQYTAGGLFQWVEYGYQTVESWRATATAEELSQAHLKDEGRWKEWLNMFSTVDEVQKYWAEAWASQLY